MALRMGHLSSSGFESAGKHLKVAVDSFDHQFRHIEAPPVVRAFVTVSREPGAGAISFSHRLAERLNQSGEGDWLAWDKELVEKVSAESGIARDTIETLEEHPHNWLIDLIQGFSATESPPDILDAKAYKRVARSIRVLAEAGHAIIVGRGGRFITAGMPAGVHLRLIAPLENRIKMMAEREQMALNEAAAKINVLDARRKEFYRRFWPGKVIGPELFTMTLNVAELTLDELVDCVLPIIRNRDAIMAGSH